VIKSMSVMPAEHSSLPSIGTIGRLFVGGFAGLMVWEIWARFITVVVLGGPLEPAGLVTSLVQHWTGHQMPRLAAETAHYVVGIVGYPVACCAISPAFPYWAPALGAGVGGTSRSSWATPSSPDRRRRLWPSFRSSSRP
jgi:hypothetical protein